MKGGKKTRGKKSFLKKPGVHRKQIRLLGRTNNTKGKVRKSQRRQKVRTESQEKLIILHWRGEEFKPVVRA